MSAGPPRIVATDLDGTLLRSDGSVSARSRAALERAQACGALIVFVTGRPPRWLTPVADETGHRGVAICANGALLWDVATERIVRTSPIDPEAAAEIVTTLRDALPGMVFAVECAGRHGRELGFPARDDRRVAELAELLAQPVVKLLARHVELDADTLLARARDAVGRRATLTHSADSGLLEISAADVTKASALATLAREHGVGAEDVVAFGDMPNDLPLLEWAGHAVAVANAHPDVLALADEVTAANDDDGVARVLERLFR